MTFIPPTKGDYEFLTRLDTIRTQARQTALTAQPVAAYNLSRIARNYPDISPGLAYAFAAQGETNPDIIRPLWQAELATRMDTKPGTQVNVKKLNRRDALSLYTENAEDIARSTDRGNQAMQAINKALHGISDEKLQQLINEGGARGINRHGRTNFESLKAIRDIDPEQFRPDRYGSSNMFDPSPTLGLAARAVKPVADILGRGIEEYDLSSRTNPLNEVPVARDVIQGLPTAKETIRGAAIAGQAGYEAGTGVLRSVTPQGDLENPTTWTGGNVAQGQSPGEYVSSIAEQTVLGQTAMGKPAGSGFLPNPNSQANQAAAEAARKYSPYLINGHAWTPGRALAGKVVEPDSDAFNLMSGAIDATVMMRADPANLGLTAFAEARALGKTVVTDAEAARLAEESSGMFRAARAKLGMQPKGFSEFKNSQAGADWAEMVRAADSEFDIVHGMPGMTNTVEDVNGVTIPIASQLKNAKTTDEVWAAVEPHWAVTNQFRSVPRYSTPGAGSRLLQDVPHFALPTGGESIDTTLVAKISDDALVNSKAPLELRKKVWDMWARMDPTDSVSRYKGVDETFEVIKEQLKLHGIDDELAHEVTRFDRNLWTSMADFGHDAVGNQLTNRAFAKDGELNPLPHPIHDNQFLNSDIKLPEAHMIRRMVSGNKELIGLIQTEKKLNANGELVKVFSVADAADLIMGPWRRLMLMRPAWGVRVISEEALRMGAEGYNSLLSAHPLRAISYAIGSTESRWLTKLEEMGKRAELMGMESNPLDNIAGAAADVLGTAKARLGRGTPSTFMYLEDDPFYQAHYLKGPRRFAGMLDETPRQILDQFALTRAGEQMHPQAVAEELLRLRESKTARAAVSQETPGGLRDWFWGEGGVSAEERQAAQGRLTSGTYANGTLETEQVAGGTYVSKWYVDPEKRGTQGLAMGREILNDADKTGTTLFLSVDSGNEPLVRLYERAGFQQVDELPQGVTRVPDAEDYIYMRRDPDTLPESGREVRTNMARDERLNAMGGDDEAARLASDAQADIIGESTRTAHADNPALVEAIRTGELNGIPLANPDGGINPAAIREIKRMAEAGETLPPVMRIRKSVTLNETEKKALSRRLGQVTDYIFDALMPRPSDYLSRAPLFKQAWWERQTELLPYMDGPTRQRLISELDIANMGTDPVATKIREIDRKLTSLGDNAPEPIIKTFETADLVAKKYALNKTRDLLYDLSTRSQIADMGRIIAPFAEAWREVVTRWAKIAYDNPQVFRQFTNAVWQVQQPGSGSVNRAFGDTSVGDGGFLHQDSFGTEVFTYPGSELISKKLFGVPVPLAGRVSSLNMIGQGLPGIGPAVSIPLSYLLPDKPSTDWISNQLFPYGRSEGNPANAVIEQFTPSWAKQAIHIGDDPASDRLYANTTAAVAKYLMSTGEYDIEGDDAQTEINRLFKDAKNGARATYAMRAVGGFTLPAAPSPEWLAVDKKGKLTLQWRISKWYQDKVRETGSETEATDAFLNKFGVNNIMLTQPASKTVVPAAPTSEQASNWYRTHPDLVDKYPLTNGLFAPSGNKTFDNATYEAQFKRGERVQLSPEQMLRLANARLGHYLYAQAEANGADEDTLRNLREEITNTFPAYNSKPVESADPKDVIAELQRAVEDPAIARTKAGKALRLYLDARHQGIDDARDMGLVTPWTADRAYDIRLRLYDYGESLVEKYPSFQPIWDRVFNREIK